MKQHYRTLLALGIPIVIGQIGVIILGFADTLMIGHHSTTELNIFFSITNLCMRREERPLHKMSDMISNV